jgi:hypothetical protein
MEAHPFVCPASRCTYGFTGHVTKAYVSDSNQIMVACVRWLLTYTVQEAEWAPRGRSGRVRKISLPNRDSIHRTVQPVAQSLYQLSYPARLRKRSVSINVGRVIYCFLFTLYHSTIAISTLRNTLDWKLCVVTFGCWGGGVHLRRSEVRKEQTE